MNFIKIVNEATPIFNARAHSCTDFSSRTPKRVTDFSTTIAPSTNHKTGLTSGNKFLDPRGKNLLSVQNLLHQLVDGLTEELSNAVELAPVPTEWMSIPKSQLIPDQPVSDTELLETCRQLVRGSMNPAHPRYMGHMDPLPSISSVMGSLVTAAVNNNVLSREMSPIFSELEQQLMRELALLFGLPETAGGMLQSGGTLCNLQALTVARNSQLGLKDVHENGLIQLTSQPVIFASELCHSSIQKSAMILGLGTEAVLPVKVDDQCRICPKALQNSITQARQSGQLPFAVVATAGTTVTGNIDPLSAIAKICQNEKLWFHVDASYGGAAIFSETHKPCLQGIDRADSITFNPQKWCYVTKACALVLFREEKILDRHFRIAHPYMSLNEEDHEINLGEWGIQGTRAPEIAKWWLTLLQFGKSGLEKLIDHSYDMANRFNRLIDERDFIECASVSEMNIVCFRDTRGSQDETARGERNQRLQRGLMKDRQTFVSLPRFRNSRWLKAVLLNPFTTENDLQEIFDYIDHFEV